MGANDRVMGATSDGRPENVVQTVISFDKHRI